MESPISVDKLSRPHIYIYSPSCMLASALAISAVFMIVKCFPRAPLQKWKKVKTHVIYHLI